MFSNIIKTSARAFILAFTLVRRMIYGLARERCQNVNVVKFQLSFIQRVARASPISSFSSSLCYSPPFLAATANLYLIVVNLCLIS